MYLVSVYYVYVSGVAGISAYLVLEKLEIMILVKQQLRRMVKEAPTLLYKWRIISSILKHQL